MSASWTEPARELVDRLGVGLDALWAMVFTAQSPAGVGVADEPTVAG